MDELLVVSPATGIATPPQASPSAISWAAILAGAAAATATSLVLLLLAAGLGLASVSAWPYSGASATTVSAMAAIALVVTQWFSAGVGGYLAGRLRLKWAGTHTHEAFFRDTAHGFVTWAVATLLVTGIVAGGAASLAAGGARAAAGAVPAAVGAAANGQTPYDIQTLFRTTSGADPKAAGGMDAKTQAWQIFEHGLASGDLSPADHSYIAQLVAAQTGVSETEAQARVDNALTQLKAADLKAHTVADEARKDAERGSILAALSLVIGAFIASVSAALGGRLRDLHP